MKTGSQTYKNRYIRPTSYSRDLQQFGEWVPQVKVWTSNMVSLVSQPVKGSEFKVYPNREQADAAAFTMAKVWIDQNA
jgi:hypothetical protein